MGTITKREFDIRQPYFPEQTDFDDFYFKVANLIEDGIAKTELGQGITSLMRSHLALMFVGYLQDVVNDAGIWRSFVDANRKLYGYAVPFHELSPDYIDYELNREDIRFLAWYGVAMMDVNRRALYPLDSALLDMADKVYDFLNKVYEDAPMEVKYDIVRGLSLTDPADQEDVFHLAHWLFNNCWLMTPAYALTLNLMVNSPEVRADSEGITLNKMMDAAVSEDPTGPLALFTPEWIYLLINRELPETALPHKDETPAEPHPYYAKFTAATGGKRIAYFKTYDELNRFFIEKLGWEKGQEHLVQMKDEHDFVLLVNPAKGMLLAKNVAKCIADPENPLYDKAYARIMAIELLAVRGKCPADLLSYIEENDWLPDAQFPGSGDTELVRRHWDFIARCYLQEFYRGD